MIETVAFSGELPRSASPVLSEDRWDRRRGPTGPRYVLRDRPDGISSVAFQTSGGVTRWSAEGNLTTALYGPQATAGTLTPAEVPRAVHVLTEVALAASETVVPDARVLTVSRFDPSRSLLVPPAAPAEDLVKALWQRLWPRRSDRVPVWLIGSNGDTVAMGKRGGDVFRRVYSKTPEARAAGKPCPPNVLRLETERRPRHRLYLDETELLMEIADRDLEQIAQWMTESVAAYTGTGVAALVEGQKALGEDPDPTEALRLSGALAVLATRGVAGLVELGVPQRSAYRMKARTEALLVAAHGGPTHNLIAQSFAEASTLLARDVVTYGAEQGLA